MKEYIKSPKLNNVPGLKKGEHLEKKGGKFYVSSDSKKKEVAKKMRMKEAANAWERHVNKMERLHVLARRRQIKKEGFKSELDYFTNKKNV